MRTIGYIPLITMIVLLSGCGIKGKGMEQSRLTLPPGQHPLTFEKQNLACRYWLFLPAGYGEKQKTWPTILFLHGAGERGDDLEKIKSWDPLKPAEKQKDFPFIVIAPQCPEGGWWSKEKELDVLITLLDYIVSSCDVDKRRIYLTGLSMGGYGTWELSCEYPDRFAAIAPFCGGGPTENACNLKDVPVWAFHGAKDDVVPLKKSEEMVEAVRACGGDARFTLYPDVGHGCWDEAYNGQELYDWFLTHEK